MDNQLPRQKKLKDAQNLVKDLIENEPRKTRRSKVSQRTRDEEDRLREKVKEMEKENPNADFTVIFSSDKAEQARREQHKRAFANYKAFQFLKHGIDLTKTS